MNLRFIRYASLLAMSAILLAGCAAAVPMLGSAASAALQMTGLGKPDVPDAQKPPRDLGLTLYAAQNLNAANDQIPPRSSRRHSMLSPIPTRKKARWAAIC
jgi:type VI secretion system protein VasD